MNENILKFLGSKTIDYQTMNNKLNDFYERKVTFFVDYEMFTRILYSDNTYKIIKEDMTGYELCLFILNLCAHYKYYFRKRNIEAEFYIIFATKKNKDFMSVVPEFNLKFYNEISEKMSVTKYVLKNTKKLIEILKYLPDIKFIDSDNIDPYMMPYFFKNSPQKKIIYSNNSIVLSYLIHVSYNVLIPKKENSLFLNKQNLMETIGGIDYKHINVHFINFILSFTGIKKYHIPNVRGYDFKKIFKIIDSRIKTNYIMNIEYNLNTFIKYFNADQKFKKADIERVIDNFCLVDRMINFKILTEERKLKIESQINENNIPNFDLVVRYDTDYFENLLNYNWLF